MAKMKKWTPIKSLACTFDGQGHALLNWKTKCGLFELVEEKGVVQNLRIDSSCSMNVNIKGDVVVGFIAHINKGTIQKCENGGSITYKGGYTEQHIYIGGLAGQNGRTIRDSRNSGIISVESVIASANKSLNLLVGGIAGSTVPKGSRVIIIYRCENKAPITIKSDVPRIYAGGIVGYSGRAGIRYCTNSGGISATGSKGNPEAKYYANVGGITGQSGQHIQCSDNFGRIHIDGSHISYAGGICGSLNAVRNIVGCSNYGEVLSTCATASNFAGIIGASGDGVHLCNCNNYGAVSYRGSTAPKGTQLGGVAGYIFSKKNTKYGSRLLRCNNFGALSSGVASKNLSVGGLVGRIRGSEVANVKLQDCANKGEISAKGCRVGSIASSKSYTTISGDYFHNNMAQPVKATKGDKNLFSRVTSTTGEPVVGAVVSDGEFSVQTNSEGYYEMKSNLASARFVTISTPADYKLSFRKSVPQNFLRIPRHATAVEANFVLEKREKSTEKYSVVMIGDPQAYPLFFATQSQINVKDQS
jgi:hypothetical protein